MDLHHVSSSLISDMFFGQVKRVKIVTRVIMIMIFNATFHSISVLFFDWRLLISSFGIVKPFWHIQLLTRRVSLVEQELPTLPVNLSSPQIFSEVNVACSLVLCVYFVDRCLSFCPFSFGHCVVCPSSINGFWLPVWYRQKWLKEFANRIFKKSLKIPKGQSESVYRRRTDNTMAKRKRTKGQTTIYKTYI